MATLDTVQGKAGAKMDLARGSPEPRATSLALLSITYLAKFFLMTMSHWAGGMVFRFMVMVTSPHNCWDMNE